MGSGWFKAKLASRGNAAPASVVPPLAPEILQARLRNVTAQMATGHFGAARTELELLLHTNPTSPDGLANLGVCTFMQGDVEVAVAPLAAAIRIAPDHALAHKFLAASLAALKRDGEALPIAQKAAQLNPADAQIQVLAASQCISAGNYPEAARYLNLALRIQPDSADALRQLEILSRQSTWKRSLFETEPRIAESRRRVISRLTSSHNKHAIDADQLATLLYVLEGSPDTFQSALRIARSSTEFKPMGVTLAEQLAWVFWVAGDVAQTVRFREFCFAQEPESTSIRFALSNAWLMQGRQHWSESWALMVEALHRGRSEMYVSDVPRWTGQRLGRKQLLVYQDQGVGDAILALRFLPILQLRGIRFKLWVLPTLAELAIHVEGVEDLIRSDDKPSALAHGCSYAVPLFGLITALGLGPDDVRTPAPIKLERRTASPLTDPIRALPGVRVGLVYGGNPDRRDDWLRTPPPNIATALASIDQVSWVNLMFDKRKEKDMLVRELRMVDAMAGVRSFADTAAIVDELDAVVAVDSSAAHVAACLGKPVWVLAPTAHDWRWQSGPDKNPWWPSVHLLRSEAPGIWTGAIEQLRTELTQFVATHSRHAAA